MCEWQLESSYTSNIHVPDGIVGMDGAFFFFDDIKHLVSFFYVT